MSKSLSALCHMYKRLYAYSRCVGTRYWHVRLWAQDDELEFHW